MRAIPEYHHWVMRIFYLGWWMRQYQFARSQPFLLFLLKSCNFWLFYIGPLLTISALALCFARPRRAWLRDRSTRFLLMVCGVVWVGALLPVYFGPHYVARDRLRYLCADDAGYAEAAAMAAVENSGGNGVGARGPGDCFSDAAVVCGLASDPKYPTSGLGNLELTGGVPYAAGRDCRATLANSPASSW